VHGSRWADADRLDRVVNGLITGPLGIPTINIPANPAPNTTYGIPGIARE
jgi:hypothetical protein